MYDWIFGVGWGFPGSLHQKKKTKTKTPYYTEMYTGWITHFSSVLVVLWLFQPLPWESWSLKITPASLQSAENQNVQYVRYTHLISCNLWLAILFCGVLMFYNFCGWLDSYEKFSFTKIDASIWSLDEACDLKHHGSTANYSQVRITTGIHNVASLTTTLACAVLLCISDLVMKKNWQIMLCRVHLGFLSGGRGQI